MLLKTYGSHNAILNVIASNDPENFIYHGIDQDHWMVDNILPELSNYTATHYITFIKQYFGSADATRTQNAIGLDFVYEQCFAAKEYNLYGSSRLGVKKDTSLLVNTRFKASSIDEDGEFVKDVVYFNHIKETDTVRTARILAFKQFELSNHLGNVLATILDRRTLLDTTIYNSGNDTAALWDADIVSAQDYYAFGMLLPDRIYTADSTGSGGSRYGFNGMERDDEWNGKGNAYDFGARMYDSRLGRWYARDPAEMHLPYFSPYVYTYNCPINIIDPEGEIGTDPDGNIIFTPVGKPEWRWTEKNDKEEVDAFGEPITTRTGEGFYAQPGFIINDAGEKEMVYLVTDKTVYKAQQTIGQIDGGTAVGPIELGEPVEGEDASSQCTGTAFVDGKFVFYANNVDKDFLKKEGFAEIEGDPQPGDIGLYYNKKGQVVHAEIYNEDGTVTSKPGQNPRTTGNEPESTYPRKKYEEYKIYRKNSDNAVSERAGNSSDRDNDSNNGIKSVSRWQFFRARLEIKKNHEANDEG